MDRTLLEIFCFKFILYSADLEKKFFALILHDNFQYFRQILNFANYFHP